MSAPSQNTRGRGQEEPQSGGGGGAPSRGSVWEQVPPEPPSKLILQNSLRNSEHFRGELKTQGQIVEPQPLHLTYDPSGNVRMSSVKLCPYGDAYPS